MRCAVILAGGLSRRMKGPDKSLVFLNGQPMIGHVIARIAPQVNRVAINAGASAKGLAHLGLELISDEIPDHPGPLAGVLAAIGWAALQGADRVLTVPTDCPFLPSDLYGRLDTGSGLTVARSASGLHPVCAIWPVRDETAIRDMIVAGTRRMRDVTAALGAHEIAFDEIPDPFFNVNTPDDLAAAAERL